MRRTRDQIANDKKSSGAHSRETHTAHRHAPRVYIYSVSELRLLLTLRFIDAIPCDYCYARYFARDRQTGRLRRRTARQASRTFTTGSIADKRTVQTSLFFDILPFIPILIIQFFFPSARSRMIQSSRSRTCFNHD